MIDLLLLILVGVLLCWVALHFLGGIIALVVVIVVVVVLLVAFLQRAGVR